MCSSRLFSSFDDLFDRTDPFGRTDEPDDSLSLDARADRHVKRVKEFYAHLASYVGVNALLVAINLLTVPGTFWAVWPILGWGVHVAVHAATVFGLPSLSAWEDRIRARYLRRHGARPSAPRPSPSTDAFGNHARPTADSAGDADDLRRRVRNLETIVTSADWDLLVDVDTTLQPDDTSAANVVSRLADEVVQT